MKQKHFYLIKSGELSIKRGNRPFFLKILKANLRRNLSHLEPTLSINGNRIYLECLADSKTEIEKTLTRTFGIAGFTRAVRCEKNMKGIEEGVISVAQSILEKEPGSSFKIEARRTDKSFSLDSYELADTFGNTLRQRFPESRVDVHNPDWILNIEIREDVLVYLYGGDFDQGLITGKRGSGGLPVGTSGRGMLLLSGGIDSPVAGYLMAKRGLKLDAVYFHTPPYTPDEALDKVIDLGKILSPYLQGLVLLVVPFTDIQLKLKQETANEKLTLFMRAAMVEIASRLAAGRNAGNLVTGESLGQVASQTQESLRFTGSFTDLALFRPLIGMDKFEIIDIAKRINTYETSILPYEDCCTVFAPSKPLVRPRFEPLQNDYSRFERRELIEQAVEKTETIRL
ncbi:MAG: tRNA 4-thiouridine(8) synthase ThiI [Spirochaetales bacterium]|nr:tRNA 4-thiouridine(8) synthase ThiI [Spirochaetales bacterium]MCF7937175.1 tRNA 4-thiouridine(8) synthase ThiI [Spirochaetales bacterium]